MPYEMWGSEKPGTGSSFTRRGRRVRFGPPPQVLWVTCGNTSNARMPEILLKSFPEARTCSKQGEPLVEISDAR